jgi:hypothetical protein
MVRWRAAVNHLIFILEVVGDVLKIAGSVILQRIMVCDCLMRDGNCNTNPVVSFDIDGNDKLVQFKFFVVGKASVPFCHFCVHVDSMICCMTRLYHLCDEE